MDDHGNRFLVATFPTKIDAENHIKKLTAGVHKQHYWVEEESNSEKTKFNLS